MVRMAMAAASLLALAACGGSDAGGNESGGKGAPAAASGVQLQPGLWETKVQFVNVEGVPKEMAAAMAGTAEQVDQDCITPEDVAKANAGLFAGEEQENCKQEGFAFQGGKVQGKLTCTGGDTPGTATLEMQGTYSANTYDIAQKMTTSAEGMNMVWHSRITGRRVGECTAEQQKEG